MKRGIPAPPRGLGREAKRLWLDCHEDFCFGPDSLALLRVACFALERLLQAKKILDREGVTFKTETGQIKQHPACSVEKDARSGFVQAIRLLGISYDEAGFRRGPGRPPDQSQESLF